MPRPIFEAVRDGTRGFNENREAKQAAAELKADQQNKAVELASLGRGMHEHYRHELSKLAADYRRDKAAIGKDQRAELAALKADNSAMIRETMRAISSLQDRAHRTTAWREKSLLGRAWNAVDAGRTAESLGKQIGKAFWAAASTSARMASLATNQTRQRQAVYGEVTDQAGQRKMDLRSSYHEKFETSYQEFVAARESTLRQYEAEQKDYQRQWAERNEASREAWQQFRKTYEPLEAIRQLHERQKEALRRFKGREEQTAQPSRGRGRSRSFDLER